MQGKPRYSRVSDILDLAIFMSSKAQGVTINEIADRYKVSRRTAERMRDSLMNIFPQVDEIETKEAQKHWGFSNYSIAQMIAFSSKEIGNIEQLQRRTTNKEMKVELSQTVEKMKALNKKDKDIIQNHIDMYMQTEGYAVRQMPQHNINVEMVEVIRDALQYSKTIKGIYHEKERELEPLGLIYGEKIHLIAREKAKGEGIYNYLLHKFEDLKLTKNSYDKGGFNLQEYTNLSFGVYHSDPLDVELLFSADVADDASKFNFHPSQTGKLNEDGTYTVKFKASGSREIIWHVFKWNKHCKIVAPQSLQDEYKQYLQECLEG